MSDNVKFRLPGPFGLPAAQSAAAMPLAETVEVRLRVLIEGRPETIVFQMIPHVAEVLAAELQEAAIAARKAK